MRRGFLASVAAANATLSWTVGPAKRPVIESPRRPASVQAPKRIKLVGTPVRPRSAGEPVPVSCLKEGSRVGTAKKTVSFQSPQHEEDFEEDEMPSPTFKFHRISAVTEVTEPEESVHDADTPEDIQEEKVAVEMGNEMMDLDEEKHGDSSEDLAEVGQEHTVSVLATPEHELLEDTPEEEQSLEEVLYDLPIEDVVIPKDGSADTQTSTVSVQTMKEETLTPREQSVDMESASTPTVFPVTEEVEPMVLELEPLTILSGMIFYVDVWSAAGTNASEFFAPLLLELGASVSPSFTDSVTHVLFKDGSRSTLEQVYHSDGAICALNVGWAVE